MDDDHELDDEVAGIVDLDRGDPDDCVRIASTLSGINERAGRR